MRPDTPLCESLRPRRRRPQLPGRRPALRPARPPPSPPGPGAAAAAGPGAGRREEGARGGDALRPRRPPPRAAAPVGSQPVPRRVSLPPTSPPLTPSSTGGTGPRSPLGRRGRDGRGRAPRPAPRLRATGLGALFPLGRFFPAPFTLSPLVSLGDGSSLPSSFPLRPRAPSVPRSGLSGNFLEGPRYAGCLPPLSPFPLHLSPIPSFLPLLPSPPSFLSLFDHSYFSFPIPVRLILSPPFLACMCISCLSVYLCLPRPLSLSLSSAINFPDWLPGSSAADEPYSFPGLTLSTCPG